MSNAHLAKREEKTSRNTPEYLLLVAFISLCLPLLLFIFKYIDDNRLTSWDWVFSRSDLPTFMAGLSLAILAAYLLSGLPLGAKGKTLLLWIAPLLLAVPFWQEPEVIVDAARYFTQAKLLATHGIRYYIEQWGKEIFAWTDLPLIPLVYGLIFKFFGETRLYIQITNTLLLAGTILLTNRLGTLLWDDETGFYGGLLLLSIPYLFTQVPLMLVDIPTMFLLMLAVVTFAQAVQKGGPANILLAGTAFFLAFFAKYSTWVLLSIHGLLALVLLKSQRPSIVIRRSLLVALCALLLILLLAWRHKDIMIDQMILLNTYQKPGLKRWSESLFSTFFFQTNPLVTLAALASAWLAWRSRDIRYLVVLYLVFLLLVVLEVKRIRYTIPIFPMLALMAAYSLVRIPQPRVKRFLVLSMVTTSLFIAIFGFLPFLKKMSDNNITLAGQFLDDHAIKHAQVFPLTTEDDIINPVVFVPLLDLATKTRLSAIPEPITALTLDRVQTSSLRFTWEYAMPAFYTDFQKQPLTPPEAMITISKIANPALPPNLQNTIRRYTKLRSFTQTNEIFQHNTFVTIYFN